MVEPKLVQYLDKLACRDVTLNVLSKGKNLHKKLGNLINKTAKIDFKELRWANEKYLEGNH